MAIRVNGGVVSGEVTGRELDHYAVTAGGPNFQTPAAAQAFFDIVEAGQPGSGSPNHGGGATIAMIGVLKTAGTGQRFALESGSGFTAASLSTLLSCTITDFAY